MKLKINRTNVKGLGCILSWETFQYITGKEEGFLNNRINKSIILIRDRGRIIVRDTTFIIGQIYKNNNKYFRCVCNDKSGALLESVNNELKVEFATSVIDWEIVNEDTVNSIYTKKRRRRKRKVTNI